MKPDVWDQIEKLGSADSVEDGGQVKGETKAAENAALADASGFQDGYSRFADLRREQRLAS